MFSLSSRFWQQSSTDFIVTDNCQQILLSQIIANRFYCHSYSTENHQQEQGSFYNDGEISLKHEDKNTAMTQDPMNNWITSQIIVF